MTLSFILTLVLKIDQIYSKFNKNNALQFASRRHWSG